MHVSDRLSVDAVKAHAQGALERIAAHPFVREAAAGRLGRAQTLRWVLCAGRESRVYPTLLANVISWVPDAAVAEILRGNLDDELGNGDIAKAHFQYYLYLLDRLGIPRAVFDAYREGPGVTLALELARNISTLRNPAIALGYMAVNEGMTPVAFSAAKVIVSTHFPGVSADFFDLHIAIDEWHVAELYRALACLDQASLADVRYGIDLGERGMGALLDEAFGIYEYSASTGETVAPS